MPKNKFLKLSWNDAESFWANGTITKNGIVYNVSDGIIPIIAEEFEPHVYGFHINGSESDPSNAVTYLRDAIGLTPAKMNYGTGMFEYGSWKNAFFMPRPCMVKFDGTTDYYLNEDAYDYKEDGTASDVANDAYNGNAMMEWGGKGKIWYKIVPDAGDDKSASIFIANFQEDSDYKCWSFINNNGAEVNRFYTPIYTAWFDSNGRMRSLSNKAPKVNTTASQEITASQLNNPTGSNMWYTEVFADIQLINFLLILISKSLDSQTKFGQGFSEGGSQESHLHKSGLMNNRGLFWGSSSTTGDGVKVFGMENWWGNHWRRYAGHICASGTQKIKLTYGTQDGSTASAYNTEGTGYLSKGVTPTGTSGGYIDRMTFDSNSMLAKNSSGTSTTYYCDGQWFNNSITAYARRGGSCGSGSLDGLFFVILAFAAGYAYWHIGSALSCKPLS